MLWLCPVGQNNWVPIKFHVFYVFLEIVSFCFIFSATEKYKIHLNFMVWIWRMVTLSMTFDVVNYEHILILLNIYNLSIDN